MEIKNVYNILGNAVQTGNKVQVSPTAPFPDLPANVQKTAAINNQRPPSEAVVNSGNFVNFEKYNNLVKISQETKAATLPVTYDKTGKGLSSFQNLIKESESNSQTDLSSFISLII